MAYKQVAASLETHTEEMTETWMLKVRDSKRPNLLSNLTNSQLRDHIPNMMQEICQLIRAGGQATATNTRAAREDAHVRFQQHCGIGDLMEVISLLRMVVLDYLAIVCSDASMNLSIESYAAMARIVNSYLDEELQYASSLYGTGSGSS
jgi:hypothetical protein